MRVLVTGGAGFIGSNLVRWLLRERSRLEVINLDLLTYAGRRENLADLEDHPRHRFVHGDICDGPRVRELIAGVDAVLHLAAESHVDRSIRDDAPFVRTNVVGTQVLLAAAVETGLERFVHVSTDEVYGELPWRDPADEPTEVALERFRAGEEGAPSFFLEETPLEPRSPYSATKAAGDHLVLAYHVTHDLDAVVTRCSNNYGPYQYPEKLIPLMITHALEGRTLPVYGDGLHVRDWIHVEDHCRALAAALEDGRTGAIYNLGGKAERKNLDVVRAVVRETGADPELVTRVEDRQGHDRRYAIDPAKAEAELGWRPRWTFEEGLAETVAWYRERPDWWKPLVDGRLDV